MKLTAKRALELTRDMWDWLAENPGKWKGDWIEWQREEEDDGGMVFNGEPILSNCFLCHYAGCWGCEEHCPLYGKWGGGDYCENPKAEYIKWGKARTPKTRSKYAKKIADLCREKLGELK